MKTRSIFATLLFVAVISFSTNLFAQDKEKSLIAEVVGGKSLDECSKMELIERYTVLISAYSLEQNKNIVGKLELMVEKINNKELRGKITAERASKLRITVLESFLEAKGNVLEAEESLKTLVKRTRLDN